MTEKFRTYYSFILGAMGGLTGWYLGLAFRPEHGILLQQIFFGAILGAMIGYALAAFEGFASGSLLHFLKLVSISIVIGMIAGTIALPSAEITYQKFYVRNASVTSLLKGEICWIIFGGIVGFGQTITKGTQSYKGLIGGILGGAIGGSIYELGRLRGMELSWTGQRFLALSLALLGGAIAISTTLVTTLLRRAWIQVVDGKYAGRTFDVTKFVSPKAASHRRGIIGSDELRTNIFLPGDTKVLPLHAELGYADNAPVITVRPEAFKRSQTLVNGRTITGTCPLGNGDRIIIGATNLIYHQKH